MLYGTNMGDSNQHLHYDVPHILAGGASGQLQGRTPPGVPHQDRDDREPAVEHSGYVRNPSGVDRRQHRPPRGSGLTAAGSATCKRREYEKCASGTFISACGVSSDSLACGVRRAVAAQWPTLPRRAIRRRFAPSSSRRPTSNAPQADGATAIQWAAYRNDLGYGGSSHRRGSQRQDSQSRRLHSRWSWPRSTAADR